MAVVSMVVIVAAVAVVVVEAVVAMVHQQQGSPEAPPTGENRHLVVAEVQATHR